MALELWFPQNPGDPLAAGPRSGCGKKNCLRTPDRNLFWTLPVPFPVSFGGSGSPNLEFLNAMADGSRIPWLYNNMIAHSNMSGFVICRLSSKRDSHAILAEANFRGNSVLTVNYIELFMTVLFPRFGISRDFPEPIRLQMTNISDSGIVSFASAETPTGQRAGKFFGSLDVTVSPQQHVTIHNLDLGTDSLSFSVSLSHELDPVPRRVIWFLHDPFVNHGAIPVGFLKFKERTSSVTVPLTKNRQFVDSSQLIIEVVSLDDPRHIWGQQPVMRH